MWSATNSPFLLSQLRHVLLDMFTPTQSVNDETTSLTNFHVHKELHKLSYKVQPQTKQLHRFTSSKDHAKSFLLTGKYYSPRDPFTKGVLTTAQEVAVMAS